MSLHQIRIEDVRGNALDGSPTVVSKQLLHQNQAVTASIGLG